MGDRENWKTTRPVEPGGTILTVNSLGEAYVSPIIGAIWRDDAWHPLEPSSGVRTKSEDGLPARREVRDFRVIEDVG